MRVFVAGSTGVIGKRLVPLLVEGGHDVTGLVRTAEKGDAVTALGARVAVADALNERELTTAIEKAQPEVIVHQLTALAGRLGNFKTLDRDFALTNRLRSEVTDTLLTAARRVGARRLIAQSFCGWPFTREGGPVKNEEDPLGPAPGASFVQTLAAIQHVEDAVRAASGVDALALRYGMFYGPGTTIAADGPIVSLLEKRGMPIVGSGAGVWSFIHVDDAARATAAAVSRGAPGIYNVVDDEPASVSTWLPYLAEVVGAKPPRRVPAWLAKLLLGEGGVAMMTTIRGGSNEKAKRELAWPQLYPTWRRGFVEGLG